MATTIKLKNGTGVPSAGSLVVGEPALDLTNKRLYTENSSGTVIEVGTNPTSLTTGTFTSTGIDDNAASTAITIDGSQNVGIGATTVDQHLHVEGAGTQAIKVETTADDYAIMQYKTSTSSLWQSFASPTNDYRIGISGTGDAITINSSLNVGIGTSSPDVFSRSYTGTITGISSASGETALMLNSSGTNVTALEMGRAGTRELMLYDTPTASQLFSLTSKPLAFGTAGVERMRLDSSGNVGIGTASPSARLEIKDGDNTFGTSFVLSQSYNSAYSSIASNFGGTLTIDAGVGAGTPNIIFRTNSTERMRIDSSGNVLVGTTNDNPAGANVAGHALGASGYISTTRDGGFAAFLNRKTSDGEIVRFGKDGSTVGSIGSVAGTSLSVISAGGTLYLGGDQSGSVRAINNVGSGQPRLDARNDATTDLGGSSNRFKSLYLSGIAYINSQIVAVGTYTQTTATAANVNIRSDGLMRRSTSSIRYKNTVLDATHGLTELLALRPVTYKGNDDGDAVFGGLIAEEVHDAGLTEFVQYNEDNQPDALAYGNMVSLCIKAIQEQQATITALEARITELETP